MPVKKLYSFTNKRQIWRILPTAFGKLIIEERDTEKREAFFNCIDIKSGKEIFSSFQLEEKFWIGIEKIFGDIIFFHRYRKPNMPGHLGIIALDISDQNILWKTDEFNFLFIYRNDLYCYKEKFDGRQYFKLNIKTGELLEDLGDNSGEINLLRDKSLNEENFEGYYFPKRLSLELEDDEKVKVFLSWVKNQKLLSGKIEYIDIDNLIFFSFTEVLPSGGAMRNLFNTVDINTGKVIFEEELNRGISSYIPDSFFVKDDLLFLIKNKSELVTCSIKK